MSTIEKAVEKLESDQAAAEEVSEHVLFGTEILAKVASEKSSRAVKPSAVEPAAAKSAAVEAAAVEAIQRRTQETNELKARAAVATPAATNAGSPAGSRLRLELPFAVLAEKGMVTPIAPRSRVAEELRTVKRPLLRNIDGQSAAPVANANLIMVTSALQGDGKTFNAINLAMSIAMEQDKTVLFVDADVSKASAGNLLGVPEGSLGLIDLLEDKGVKPSDVILGTNVENLRVMPAGTISERSTELLASQSMRQLMLEMSNRYPDRVIVFDSPPLLLTTEAAVLASFMGQIVFVVSTDNTPSDAVTEALEHISADKIIGLLLNKAHSRRSALFGLGSRYGYGYGYGHGYGYGYGEGRRRDSKAQNESEAQAG